MTAIDSLTESDFNELRAFDQSSPWLIDIFALVAIILDKPFHELESEA